MTFSLNSSLSIMNETEEEWTEMEWINLSMGGLMINLCLTGFLSNLVSTVIYFDPTFRHTSINVLLASLSIIDACLLLLAVPTFAFVPLSSLVGELLPTAVAVWYKYTMLYIYPCARITRFGSIWILVMITFERWIAVCWPFRAVYYCTRTRAIGTVCTVCLAAVSFHVIRFWEYRAANDDGIIFLLRTNRDYMQWYNNAATTMMEYGIPLVLLCALSFMVIKTMNKAKRMRRRLSRMQINEYSTTNMMIAVIVVFLICSTISFVLNVVEPLNPEFFHSHWGYVVSDVNNLLVMINSSSTCVFYYKFSSNYRKRLKRLLQRYGLNCGKRELLRFEIQTTTNRETTDYQTLNSCSPGSARIIRRSLIQEKIEEGDSDNDMMVFNTIV